jgi:hypothetical protein
MRWIRSKLRGGAYLALMALALQVALSFGHVHLDGSRLSAPSAVTADAGQQELAAQTPAKPQKPSKHSNDADDGCAICRLIQMVGISAPPVPPSLPLPDRIGRADRTTALVFASVAAPYRQFRARAPPLA